MNERDQRIGRNIAAMRGDLTQKELADRMASRGWKWSQSTVWSVESGKRPLRFAEAVDISYVLDSSLADLEGSEEDIERWFYNDKYFRAIDDLRDAIRKSTSWQIENAERYDSERSMSPAVEELLLESVRSDNIIGATIRLLANIAEDEFNRLPEDRSTAPFRSAVVQSWMRTLGRDDNGEHPEAP